jgi:hypothetical protein
MPRLISFASTTPALVTGNKIVTRRVWREATARQYHADDLVAAYDRNPRYKGQQVGLIQLTGDPVLEPISAMPDSDYAAEGFAWLWMNAYRLPPSTMELPLDWERFYQWRDSGAQMWVLRFALVNLTPYGGALRARYG